MTRLPKYCLHKQSGRAYVTINGKQIMLGPHGTPASRAEYDRIITEYLTNNRQLPESPRAVTVDELCDRFLDFAETYYMKNGEPTTEYAKYVYSIRMIHEPYGDWPADRFNSTALEETQERAVQSGRLCRKEINGRITRIKRIFKWGGKKKLVSASVYHDLLLVDGLKEGRTEAVDYDDITPVPLETVVKTLPHCPPMIGDMILVQLLSGIRPGEVCTIRTCDIDRSDDIWVYRKKDHKTAHHGKKREIALNYQCQDILTAYLMDLDGVRDAYVFSAARSVADQNLEKRRVRKTSVQPSQRDRRKSDPQTGPKDKYRVDSYRRAIHRACKRAGIEPWSPNRLRKTRGTDIRDKYGLDAAQAILGHANANTTEIYAKVNLEKAKEVMRKDDFKIEAQKKPAEE